MRKSLRFIGRLLGGLVVVLLVVGVAFANLSPEFGGKPTKEQKLAYAQSGHYNLEKEEFQNLVPTTLMTGGSTFSALWRFLFSKQPNTTPAAPLPMRPLDSLSVTQKSAETLRVTWFGHSASLVEIAGQNILLDPMLSVRMGPVHWATPKRYNPSAHHGRAAAAHCRRADFPRPL